MAESMTSALWQNFLGASPTWYKQTIVAFLLVNPLLLYTAGPMFAGWVLVLEFIFTLALALRCYPLQPGGLLTLEAVVLGMTDTQTIAEELFANFPVILLLMFMVAGIYFMRDLLLFTFTKLLLGIRSKVLISLTFSFTAALLSAFLDALTVTAVVISVAVGFYTVYHSVASSGEPNDQVLEHHREDLEQFRAFLRNLMMHAAVGTALGGPQNLLIATKADWDFIEFFIHMAPVSMPVLAVGLVTCALVEMTGLVGYGARLPERVRATLEAFDQRASAERNPRAVAALWVQAIAGVLLVVALALHLAEVGLIGLMIIILQTAFNGITEEHQLGHAFEEALPFTALLAVFFGIVAVIHDQHLFKPIIEYVLSLPDDVQPSMFYLANGALSAISDNVFVATVYINEVARALDMGQIDRAQFDRLAIAINTGTNIPSVATPNGQAAFLFLLTSSLAPLIRLSYGRMVVLALPYTLSMGLTGYLAVLWGI